MPACTRTWMTDKVVNEVGSRSQLGPVEHKCVFATVGPHSRHECSCGLNAYEEIA